MKRRHGFTLIELLVVIAIIGLLLAILIPALSKAKTLVWEVFCKNNLKQYGIAGKMYLNDNDDNLPNAWVSIYKSIDETNHPRICQWHDASRNPDRRPDLAGRLYPYFGSWSKIHVCPTFERFAKSYGPEHAPGTCNPAVIPIEPQFTYSMNAFLGGFEMLSLLSNNQELVIRASEIRSPTSVYFFSEENCWLIANGTRRYQAVFNDNALCGSYAPDHPRDLAAWTKTTYPDPDKSSLRDSFGSFHRTTLEKRDEGLANASFMDGHVDFVSFKDTYRFSRPMRQRPPLR